MGKYFSTPVNSSARQYSVHGNNQATRFFRDISVNIDRSSILRTDSEILCNVTHYDVPKIFCGHLYQFSYLIPKKEEKRVISPYKGVNDPK